MFTRIIRSQYPAAKLFIQFSFRNFSSEVWYWFQISEQQWLMFSWSTPKHINNTLPQIFCSYLNDSKYFLFCIILYYIWYFGWWIRNIYEKNDSSYYLILCLSTASGKLLIDINSPIICLQIQFLTEQKAWIFPWFKKTFWKCKSYTTFRYNWSFELFDLRNKCFWYFV